MGAPLRGAAHPGSAASLYAGFDCSSQSLSVVVIDAARRTVAVRDSLPLPEPFLTSNDPAVVHASPLVWAAALETMLGRLAQHLDPSVLRALSGSAQQHGSVYCGERPDVLTRTSAPTWMDTSTGEDCDALEAALGGAASVARLTGSRAFPRFTAAQIRKFRRQDPDAYARTERIHLVSSFLASRLIGGHAPIDHADGSGMNLMDIRTREWSGAAVNATAPALEDKLPPLVPSSTVIGTLNEDLQRRFGLPPVRVVAWSGDNPSSMPGIGLIAEGHIGISLGTSDTIFGVMTEPRVSAHGTGHVFASVMDDYMGITVFRNGSLARERIRNEWGLTWQGFSDALRRTPAGNGGAMMVPWFEPEITPSVATPSVTRIGLDGAEPARHVRAIVEAQMMALARHSSWMGVTPVAIHATGGGAANRDILQVMADVFGVDVYPCAAADAAALGAGLRAWQADTGLSWREVVRDFAVPAAATIIAPVPANVTTYRDLQPRYIALEAAALGR